MKRTEFQRGVIAAAGIAEMYNAESSHPYRLDDCILGKLNVGSRKKPRRNRKALRRPEETWLAGFAVALAEIHRNSKCSTEVCEVARGAGMTLELVIAAGVDAFDVNELRRAGVEDR